ncbi:transmembrane protein 71 [Amia ocellicauda]|uniref:transmembrane protein 71 n=1 Tax=Amia ocellicauda TaxID=2972642 RepID=UPI003463A7DB
MALLFSGAVTSSPIKRKGQSTDHRCHRLSLSLLSPDCSYECFSIDPLTGSPCSCRRSPRLLSNGYYVLTEDSLICDEEGNLSLTPSKINVSYKENLVRIFRRRRRPRRSLASLFSVSGACGSWLGESMFAPGHSPLAQSSWLEGGTDLDGSGCAFSCDGGALAAKEGSVSTDDGVLPSPSLGDWLGEEPPTDLDQEACFSHEQFRQSLGGFLDLPPPSPFFAKKYYCKEPRQSDSAIIKTLFVIILTVCLCIALFSRWLLGGLAVAFITFMLIFTSFFLTKSTFGNAARLRKAETEDITSRNE